SLNYPFATAGVRALRRPHRLGAILPVLEASNTRGTRQIGELAVDRESVGRALRDDPESLQVILDELFNALERESAGAAARLESGDSLCYGFPPQI
ncbi:MAG TPA: hypothetical protein VET69_04710, partial [Terriglobales bacterium]|nr:hypothetical protein [Terriglobales bacterium]